jgi:hypothetical protein
MKDITAIQERINHYKKELRKIKAMDLDNIESPEINEIFEKDVITKAIIKELEWVIK